MTDELLPALPEPVSQCYVFDEEYGHRDLDASDDYFTADQLRAYAREAIRLAQAERVIHRPSGKCCSGKSSPPAGEVA